MFACTSADKILIGSHTGLYYVSLQTMQMIQQASLALLLHLKNYWDQLVAI
jgi:hypothetical protein